MSRGLALAVLATSLICGLAATARAQRGVPKNGFPSWQERMLLVYVNRARADPQADLAGCTACAEKACYTGTRVPLAQSFALNRSSRFHAANLEYTNLFQHDSPCTLVSNLSTVYAPTGSCLGQASCSCVGGTLTGSTTFSDRIHRFSSGGYIGENIAYGYASPRDTFYQWFWEGTTSTSCSYSSSNGHRQNILGSSYKEMGNGYYNVSRNMWTQDFGDATSATGTLIAGGHEPQFTTGASVAFRTNYYDTGAPSAAKVNVDGACTNMTKERGSSTNATYVASVTLDTACHRYRFEFVRPGGATVYLPETGSYGAGGTSACADWSSTAPQACPPPDQAPTIATAAAATPSPVTGTTTTLSALGADDKGEAALIYAWSATGPASVTFSANATNAAKMSTATFGRAGAYTLTVTVRDAANQTATSAVAVTVAQTLTTIAVAPPIASVRASETQAFTATAYDQFAVALTTQPATTWTVSGGGSISPTGLFTAGQTPSGPYDVTATAGGKSGTAHVTITSASAPTIAAAASAAPAPVIATTTTATVLGASGEGESTLVYRWSGSGPGDISASPNGTHDAKSSTITFTAAGSYTLTALITDAHGQTATSSVAVTVAATPAVIAVTPPTAVVVAGESRDFSAIVEDQFGAVAPGTPAWSIDVGGTVDSAGHFTAAADPGGPYTLVATGAGVTGSAKIIVSAAPDTTAPSVTIVAPVDGEAVTDATTLIADASDDLGVAAVVFEVNGVRLEVSQAPWQATWDTSAVPDGTYTVEVTAIDFAGNESPTAEVTVQVVHARADFGSVSGGCAAGGSNGGVLVLLVLVPIVRRRRRR